MPGLDATLTAEHHLGSGEKTQRSCNASIWFYNHRGGVHTKAPDRLDVIQFEDLVPVPLRHILVYITDGSTIVGWLSACKAHILNLRQLFRV